MHTTTYEVLGVSPQATDDEIKKAFRRARARVPPRREPRRPAGGGAVQGDQRRVRDAARSRAPPPYDMFGPEAQHAGVGAGARSAPAGSVSTTCSTRSSAATSFGGRGAGRSATRARRRDRDASSRSRRSCIGARQTLDLRMPVECEHLRRFGRRARHPPTNVPDLRRRGRGAPGAPLAARPDHDRRAVPDVSRARHDHRASRARPAGARDGSPGCGRSTSRCRRHRRRPAAAPRGSRSRPRRAAARRATSTSRCASLPSSTFERRGDDLWHRLPVSIVQAALGTQVELETLDGPHELDVHAGTQPGARIRLRGLGVPSLRTGRRGDLVVEVDVRGADAPQRRAGRAARAVRGSCAASR